MKVVYVGCGSSAIEGAVNLDNSPSVRIGNSRFLSFIVMKFHLCSYEQMEFIRVIRKKNIKYGDVRHLPLKDETMDVIYSSHTIEHLYEEEFLKFLNEAYRVLKYGGVFRIVLPDLEKFIDGYIKEKDADVFCEKLMMGSKRRPDFRQKAKKFIFGDRGHKWMYDTKSVKKIIEIHSKFKVEILNPGETGIIGDAGIDLNERAEESLYLECYKI